MIPYFVTYSTTFLIVWILEKQRRIKNTTALAVCFLFIAAVILALLAAFRADTIGTDVQTYVIRFFEGAKTYNSFKGYLSFYPLDYVEPGYKLFNYIVSRFTSDIRVLHFCIALFDLFFVLAYLWENRTKVSISIGLLVYMLMIYNICFNVVRQTMAICVCLYAFNSARDRKIVKFSLLIILAFLFHRSSVIMFITYPLVVFLDGASNHKKTRLIGLGVLISVVFLVFINSVVSLLIKYGVFPVKFSHYIGNAFTLSRFGAFIFVIPIVVIFIMYRNVYYERDSFNAVLFFYVFLWPILAQLDSVSDQFGRMAYYFIVANIGIYAQLPMIKKEVKNKTNIKVLEVMLVGYLVMYWIINYVIWNVGNTVPYIYR